MNIKNKKIILIGLILVSLISLVYIFAQIKKPATSIKTPAPSITIIIPGKTTENDVLKTFGTPIASSAGILQYPSNSQTRNNEVVVDNGLVDFVKEIVAYNDPITLTDLKNKYGDSPVLYGPDSINGYYLFYHLDKGVAYIANPISDNVIEIWYFTPTTLQIFKNTLAKGYTEKVPTAY